MSGFVGIIDVTAQDQTGLGLISRYHFKLLNGQSPTAVDGGNAGASVYSMYNAIKQHFPSSITWHVELQFTVIDETSGGLIQYLNRSNTVPDVVGGDSSPYAAGIGGRIEWKTATVSTKRLMRGASFMVPLGAAAFSSTGAINLTTVNDMAAAAAQYRNQMATYTLAPVVYHRPPKGTTVGGKSAPITAVVVKSNPAGLRSRRS